MVMKKYRPDSEFIYWLYDPEGDGLTFYESEVDREEAAKEAIALYLDSSHGWNEDVERVCGGVVTHHVLQTDVVRKPEHLDEDGCDEEGNYWHGGNFDYMCDYKFKPIPEL